MGIFDQAKLAADMMKNMDPSQMKELLAQAQEGQRALEEQIKKLIDEEVKKRNLVSREEVEHIIKNMRP
ncbi:MAG: hypothetical protein COU47_04095 [Candidatus Niyogibacteria bacterium CG10_big_fil_rev_8_21_14_0_10_46_36]|uniref:Uncharacterized protein n=1 Tax=Candidatus Niyogibacteria bacterium CG10_big_fil_rev_8_21_14_0_10_46_36 TaxID=1974726 RepID=A0A2H0TCG2_9BACT|nr:MAG: hypothetical protein COU47_04095 [Candidatus Niyogibacteria bacterium CG10_big_fil_rev_8_21_14_0_10_46_36]